MQCICLLCLSLLSFATVKAQWFFALLNDVFHVPRMLRIQLVLMKCKMIITVYVKLMAPLSLISLAKSTCIWLNPESIILVKRLCIESVRPLMYLHVELRRVVKPTWITWNDFLPRTKDNISKRGKGKYAGQAKSTTGGKYRVVVKGD